MSKACLLDPGYIEMSDAQKVKYEDTFWDTITTAQRRKEQKGHKQHSDKMLRS